MNAALGDGYRAALAVGAIVALTAGAACQTSRRPAPLTPRLDLVVERRPDAPPPVQPCPRPGPPERGPTPTGVTPVALVRATADRPVPLEELEELLLVGALRACADGVSVLRASARDGDEGFVDATGEAWVRPVE